MVRFNHYDVKYVVFILAHILHCNGWNHKVYIMHISHDLDWIKVFLNVLKMVSTHHPFNLYFYKLVWTFLFHHAHGHKVNTIDDFKYIMV
jgi:hypothetical protein